MKVRLGFGLVAVALLFNPGASSAELRPAETRPEVIEVGDPVMISRDLLTTEMKRNSEMKEWVTKYGWPDYAEVQEVTVREPLVTYEVRLYYLRRNHQLAFSRVYVSPALSDYGVRVYEGPISAATLDRLLTAAPGEPDVTAEAEGDLVEEPESDPVAVAVRAIDDGDDPMDRIEASLQRMEAAAERAAQAAEQAERSSLAAAQAAERAIAKIEKLDR